MSASESQDGTCHVMTSAGPPWRIGGFRCGQSTLGSHCTNGAAPDRLKKTSGPSVACKICSDGRLRRSFLGPTITTKKPGSPLLGTPVQGPFAATLVSLAQGPRTITGKSHYRSWRDMGPVASRVGHLTELSRSGRRAYKHQDNGRMHTTMESRKRVYEIGTE